MRAMNPAMRMITITGLADSPTYLFFGDTVHEEDVSILYKLHLECGRLINLYDWFVAFKSIVDPKETQESKTLQIRFMKATTELQFMGFIKPTERKTDHVERLTWV
jgi:origin recognition complex subunit 3